ncbi:radical SAM protein, partial [Chloroflexota bacterium]
MAMMGTFTESSELGPIRPPSEAFSLLLRVSRNCSWNRCRFCPVYKGDRFQLRSVAEIKRDIDTAKAIRDKIRDFTGQSGRGDREAAAMVCQNSPNAAYRNVALWMYAGGKHAFLQDANTLIMKTGELVEVLNYLKDVFPGITRVTSYARSKTAAKKRAAELVELREAGLSRLHIGLESGYDPVLKLMDKGVTAADHIAGGRNVVAAGISLSEYVMLGLGGKKMWRQHALETARVLNEINPDFIRVRTLTIKSMMPLHNDVESGRFVRQTDEEIVEEEKLMIENLSCRVTFASDHIINLLQEIEGKLPEDKEKMLAVIRRFQALPPEERANFKLGRRLGLYNRLKDLEDVCRHDEVNRAVAGLGGGGDVSDEVFFNLME